MSDAALLRHRPASAGATPGALALLMALTALGQLATNLVVPSLGEIGRAVGLSPESTGMILSMVLLGLALGQLVVGPLSDRLGRRPVLLAGLLVYLAGSIVATLAPNGTLLLAARALQGLGASAGLALPRAIARDRYDGVYFLRAMAALTMAMSVMPGLAPILGGAVSGLYGWRASLALSVVAGAAMLAATLVALPESHRDREPGGGLAGTLGGYGHVLRNRRFLALAMTSGAAIGGAYAEVAGAQRFYMDGFGWSAGQLSLATALYAAGFLLGGAMAGSLLRESRRRIGAGLSLLLFAPLVLMALKALGFGHPLLWLGLIFLSQIGMGAMLPAAIGQALMAVEGAAGTASAVLGSAQMVIGAAGAGIIAAIDLPLAWSLPVTMLGFAGLAAASLFLARR